MTDVNFSSSSKGVTVVKELDDQTVLQKTTTDMRLEFLKILNKIEGKEASFSFYKRKTLASGVFSGSDRDILHFAVSQFESPTGLMNSATIRTTDIDCMTVPLLLENVADQLSSEDEKVVPIHSNKE